jgi:hypothetical protein
MSSSVAGATRVYFTPYGPPSCPIYNGTAFVQTVFAEVFQDTTDTTKSPSAVVANSNYDLFGWLDGSTFRVTRGPAWTSSSARGTGAGTTDLVWVSGVPLNANAITNGPGAQRGTYLGTIRSNASSTIDYIFGGAASLGLAGVFNVWNCYNRTPVGCRVIDVSATYNYSSATIRQCHGSSSMQVSFVVGLAGDLLNASAQLSLFTTAVAFSFCKIGVQLDELTSFDSTAICFTGSAVSVYQIATATSLLSPSIGAHVLSMNECSDGTNANSFNQDGTGTHSGLSFSFPM